MRRSMGKLPLGLLVCCIGCLPPLPPGDDTTTTPPTPPGQTTPDAPSPTVASGLVTAPAHGATFDGKTTGVALHVTGTYSDDTTMLSVQVLDDPTDLTTWTTIATTQATGGNFAIDATPVTGTTDAARWPRGGVLRLRVIDASGAPLACDPTDASVTTLAVANTTLPPFGWSYLEQVPDGFTFDTDAYYQQIDAPATLGEFIQRFSLEADTIDVSYYNAADLGIGREMHCKATSNGGSACYVRNFGQFEGSSLEALTELVEQDTPLATVVMVYTPPIDAPNAVTFMVYDGNDDLQDSAQLDLNGNNQSIPQNCMNCHGGQSAYDVPSHTATNARFLPFDPAAFEYATLSGFSFASQESSFRAINRLVEQSAPTPAVTAVVDGMFPQDGSPYNAAWVPAAWSTSPRDAQLYTDAIAPYCRSCHATTRARSRSRRPRTSADSARRRSCSSAARGHAACRPRSRPRSGSSTRVRAR